MYPPASPHESERLSLHKDPFSDPFENDLLLHVNTQHRSSYESLSLPGPVAAKYMHKAQEVRLPRPSVVQPRLIDSGKIITNSTRHMDYKEVGLPVPRVFDSGKTATDEEVSGDPAVREKRSRELRFADPALIGKRF